MNNVTSFYLAGIQFRPEEDTKDLNTDQVLKLEAEPDNQYDDQAIKVLTLDNKFIGYVPKKITKDLHPFRLSNIPLYIYIANYIPEMPSYKRCLIAVKSKEELPKYIPESKEKEDFKDFICLEKVDE